MSKHQGFVPGVDMLYRRGVVWQSCQFDEEADYVKVELSTQVDELKIEMNTDRKRSPESDLRVSSICMLMI
jgi:hypothetical protein